MNQWGESTYKDSNEIYEGADLMRMLNTYYIRLSNSCLICSTVKESTCSTDCSGYVPQLSIVSTEMLEDAVWMLGGPTNNEVLSLLNAYDGERTSIASYSKIIRTLDWEGKVGLIYLSDYGFASSNITCKYDIYGTDTTCNTDNWLTAISGWTITHNKSDKFAVYRLYNGKPTNGHVYNSTAAPVAPSVYLSSKVKIAGGTGTDIDAYKLSK